MAGQKFVQHNGSGGLNEVVSNQTSAGVADAGKIVALNSNGVLDSTVVNSKTTSAGAGDSGKIPALNASGILDDTIINATVTSSANKVVKLDGSGKLDVTVMPSGIGADTAIITASEALSAGDWVNIYNNSGAKVRKADATTTGKLAHGYVTAAVSNGNPATVYFEGSNSNVTGMTPGEVYLSTTPGVGTNTPPSTAGNVVQKIGFATSATNVNCNVGDVYVVVA